MTDNLTTLLTKQAAEQEVGQAPTEDGSTLRGGKIKDGNNTQHGKERDTTETPDDLARRFQEFSSSRSSNKDPAAAKHSGQSEVNRRALATRNPCSAATGTAYKADTEAKGRGRKEPRVDRRPGQQ